MEYFYYIEHAINWNFAYLQLFPVIETVCYNCIQEPLPSTVVHELEDEYNDRLNDINITLNNVEITVGYLNSINEQADILLQDFMTDVLKIDRKIVRRGKVRY